MRRGTTVMMSNRPAPHGGALSIDSPRSLLRSANGFGTVSADSQEETIATTAFERRTTRRFGDIDCRLLQGKDAASLLRHEVERHRTIWHADRDHATR